MFYTHSTLDRADHLRKDDTALQALRQKSDARIVPIWNNNPAVSQSSDNKLPEALFLAHDHELPEGQLVFLGLDQNIPFFAADVSQLDEAASKALLDHAITRNGEPATGDFVDLRFAGPNLNNTDGSLLAYSRALIYWNHNTNFCSLCGQALVSRNGGHTRSCTSESCENLVFPRTDPAVIMLVSYTPEDGSESLCLLGRSPGWPDGVFSTLAGFVEPGESLEMAVKREVLEEASIRTHNERYVASQPWPFPRSIMLGYEAEALNTDIRCDPDELADAQWFTREQLRTFGNWGDEAPGFKLPRPDSISRFLIDRWVAGDNK